ncbi:hypothetical protein M378DRAFT_50672, partial [Amanita muscaria Koide BX008]
DPEDEEWIPNMMRRNKTGKGRPLTYIKGPDVMSKSLRTRQRYAQSWKNQTNLCQFGFMQGTKRTRSASVESESDSCCGAASVKSEPDSRAISVESESDSCAISDEGTPDNEEGEGHESEDSEQLDGEGAEGLDEEVAGTTPATVEAELEAWEEELEGIKNDLRKHSKMFSLSQINQLLILSNFATLRLKGLSWIKASEDIAKQWHEGNGSWFARCVRSLACHYQVFEQLPRENRGGVKNAHSWLSDENVKKSAREYLLSLPSGKVTPRALRDQVNSVIFPELGITPKKPLHEKTARRWLIKLGWRHSTIRKGIYMDGHKCLDVINYRREVFLPAMAAYEARMVHYEGPDLERIEPVLQDSEKEIIPNFHDESVFHHNDMSRSAWLQRDEHPLHKKGRGRAIHVSDFINPESGRLIICDRDGTITRDACKIIYPGANGDQWWDCNQLLVQMKDAIAILEAAHPGKQALYIFDQSSAHASLPPDALKAFEMNKSDGGKQRVQHDTVIPQSNPFAEFRGQAQKMTLPNGQPKGLQRVLGERGFNVSGLKAKCSPVCPFESQNCCMAWLLSQQDDFINQPSMLETLLKASGHECIFLPKFHCELNPIEMYWGWCKYRYREEGKKTFQDAKNAAIKYLNACPLDVIRRFINRSWRFMSAYRLGLTGKAADWVVQKQKQHRQVSQRAMMAINAVLN